MSDPAAGVTVMKTCTKCGFQKVLCEFAKDKPSRGGVTNECRQCVSNRQMGYRADNIEDYRAYQRARQRAHRQKHWLTYLIYEQLYKLANPDYRAHRDHAAEIRAWRSRYPERAAAKARLHRAMQCERLSNSYVRSAIRAVTRELSGVDIPVALITAKREQLRIHRQLKGIV